MASKLILVFSLVSVIPLIVSSLVLYQVSTSSLDGGDDVDIQFADRVGYEWFCE